MLEEFKINTDESVLVNETVLRNVVSNLFQKFDVPKYDANLAADVLVMADLRGVDTHGVSNMLRSYIEGYRIGEINPNPNWKIVRETAATANIDSDQGLGIIVTPKAMDIAITKAKNTGIGMVTMYNGRHLGMASYHAMLALDHQMIGVCVTSCPPIVLPTFGAEPRLGTNPISVAAPARKQPPFVFDAATSVVASNKIRIAHRLGIKVPSGWLGDNSGNPIMEPIHPPDDYQLLPLGSTRDSGSHKGYGLACIVDILSGILSGTGYGMMPGRPNFSHMVAAYSIEAFTDVDDFLDLMDDFILTLKSTPTISDNQQVIVPGHLEWEIQVHRKKYGIPLHKEVIQWFINICDELNIHSPFS